MNQVTHPTPSLSSSVTAPIVNVIKILSVNDIRILVQDLEKRVIELERKAEEMEKAAKHQDVHMAYPMAGVMPAHATPYHDPHVQPIKTSYPPSCEMGISTISSATALANPSEIVQG